MAKKGKKTDKVESAALILESQFRDVISKCTAIRGLTERQHYEAIDMALELVNDGVFQRLHELGKDE